METQGEELSRLRAGNASLKKLLAASKDAHLTSNAALLACKDQLLASRAAELQRCVTLVTVTARVAVAASTAVTTAEMRHKVTAKAAQC